MTEKPVATGSDRADLNPDVAPGAAIPSTDKPNADGDDSVTVDAVPGDAGTADADVIDAEVVDANRANTGAEGADDAPAPSVNGPATDPNAGQSTAPSADTAAASTEAPVAGPAAASVAATATAPASAPVTDYTDAGIPTMEYLQDRIDRKYGTALGATELAQSTAARKTHAQRDAELATAAKERLEQIRRSMGPKG